MSQQNCLRIKGKWASKIQEYDLEKKPTKLIKGQGIAKMLTQGNEKALGIICQNNYPKQSVSDELQRLENHPWYTDIIFFVPNLTFPDHLLGHKRRELRLKANKYCLTKYGLGWRNLDGLILRCVDEPKSKKLMV